MPNDSRRDGKAGGAMSGTDRGKHWRLSRRRFLASAGGGAAVALAGCLGSDDDNGGGGNGGMDEVVFGTIPIAAVGEVFIAEDQGYFEERNIDLTVERMEGFGQAVPRLVSGQYDVASGSVTAGIVNALLDGQPVSVIADQTQYWSNQPSANRFWVREELYSDDMTIDDVPDEFTYATNTQGGSLDYLLGRFLQGAGLTFDAVEIREMPFPQMISAMDQGEIDICSIPDPIGLQMGSEANAGQLLYGSQLAPEMQIGVHLAGESFMDDRPDVARRWLEAYVLGIRDYYEMGGFQNEDVAESIGDAIDLPPEAIRSSVPSLAHKNARPNVDSLMSMQEYYRCRGFTDDTVDESELVRENLLSDALSEVGELDEENARPSVETIDDWRENALNPWPDVGEMIPPANFPAPDLCE